MELRKRGRPPAEVPTRVVSIRLKATLVDWALSNDVSIKEVTEQVLHHLQVSHYSAGRVRPNGVQGEEPVWDDVFIDAKELEDEPSGKNSGIRRGLRKNRDAGELKRERVWEEDKVSAFYGNEEGEE